MSLKSWQDEFYKKSPSHKMTKRQAIEHSLLKWTGLLPKNLKKHKIYIDTTILRDEVSGMVIDAESCALCAKYYSRKWSPELSSCSMCPLAISLGNPCDKSGNNRPYGYFVTSGDPRRMIRALKKTLKELEK